MDNEEFNRLAREHLENMKRESAARSKRTKRIMTLIVFIGLLQIAVIVMLETGVI